MQLARELPEKVEQVGRLACHVKRLLRKMYCHVCAQCISQNTASTVTCIARIIRRIKTSSAKKISQEKVAREGIAL